MSSGTWLVQITMQQPAAAAHKCAHSMYLSNCQNDDVCGGTDMHRPLSVVGRTCTDPCLCSFRSQLCTADCKPLIHTQ
jgi:hypothetical protein